MGVSPPAAIYFFEVNDENAKTMCRICAKLTKKTSERRQWQSMSMALTIIYILWSIPVDIRPKLNIYKKFIRRPGRRDVVITMLLLWDCHTLSKVMVSKSITYKTIIWKHDLFLISTESNNRKSFRDPIISQ